MSQLKVPFVFIVLIMMGCGKPIHEVRNEDNKPLSELALKSSYQDVFNQVFKPHCVACHGSSSRINLENYQVAVQFLDAINRSAVVNRTMPKAPNKPLNGQEIALLAAWVEAKGPETPINGETPPPPPLPLSAKFDSIKENVLIPKCINCHSAGGNAHRVPSSTKEDLLNSPLEIVIPGNPDESGLILVLQEGANKQMPPKDSGISLVKENELNIIYQWIQNGASE